jgi:hypothetical protein
LKFKGKVQGREKSVSSQIINFYGGIDHLAKNPKDFFKV